MMHLDIVLVDAVAQCHFLMSMLILGTLELICCALLAVNWGGYCVQVVLTNPE
jgi:hypothetical protein